MRKGLEERALTLHNGQGETLQVCLRPYQPGDEAGMIACIRDEYGDTYFKQYLYEPSYFVRAAEKGTITFLVAETKENEIAGMLLLKQFYPEEAMCEIASQIFRKKCRGYGLAMPFFEYGMEILLSRPYTAAFCLPVMFHDVTQRLLYRQGLRATGLVLNVFDMGGITHSYGNGQNRKHSQGIQIKALRKQNAGVLYLPWRHREFCSRIYDSLGVKYQMDREGEKFPDCVHSVIHRTNDPRQHSMEICIYIVGTDLERRMREIHEEYPLRGKQTANVYLNCSVPQAVWAYEVLSGLGYFFTGLKPLCSARECLVMHNPGEVKIHWEDYVASEEFAAIINYVKESL